MTRDPRTRDPRTAGKLRSERLALLGLLLLAFLLPATVGAQAFGRVKVVVMHPDGTPAPGVHITVTTKERANYHQEFDTNKKGQAMISFVDATKVYQMLFELEGYPSVLLDIKPKLRETMTQEVILEPAAPPPPPAAGAGLTPAQEAFNAGVELVQAEDLEAARGKFHQAVELDPSLALAHFALAGLYFDGGDAQKAVEYADQAVRLEPGNVGAWRILYDSHEALGNKGEAKKILGVLSQMEGGADSAPIVFNEGVAAYQVGDYERAKERFSRALELKSDLTSAMSALAVVHLAQGEYAAAADLTERFLALEPGDAKVLRYRYEAYRGLGDEAKVQEAFEALAEVDPQVLAKNLFERGVKAFEAGDTDTARENFARVVEIDPGHARAHYQLALSLVSKGETALAREHLEKFLELAPEDPEAPAARDMLGYLE